MHFLRLLKEWPILILFGIPGDLRPYGKLPLRLITYPKTETSFKAITDPRKGVVNFPYKSSLATKQTSELTMSQREATINERNKS